MTLKYCLLGLYCILLLLLIKLSISHFLFKGEFGVSLIVPFKDVKIFLSSRLAILLILASMFVVFLALAWNKSMLPFARQTPAHWDEPTVIWLPAWKSKQHPKVDKTGSISDVSSADAVEVKDSR